MWRRKLEGAGSAIAEPRTGRGGCDLQNRGAGRGVPGCAQSGWAYLRSQNLSGADWRWKNGEGVLKEVFFDAGN